MAHNLTGEKAVVKNADMDEPMQKLALERAAQAVERFTVEKDIASYIKKEFDQRYGPTWHCIVGRNFGRWVVKHVWSAHCILCA